MIGGGAPTYKGRECSSESLKRTHQKNLFNLQLTLDYFLLLSFQSHLLQKKVRYFNLCNRNSQRARRHNR